MGEFGIGQPVLRTEDPRLLQGRGQYGDDFVMPNQATGYILRSPHAHAIIKSIDALAAKQAPGVLLVLTGKDWDDGGFGPFPVLVPRQKRDGSPMHPAPRAALASSRVRLVGDNVAFIVAETLAQAKDAAELIDIDYEFLPSVTDTREAAAPGAARVWDDCPDNECFFFELGDKAKVDAAFQAADHITKIDYVVNRVSANAMEPRVSIGDYSFRTGRYALHTSTQSVHNIRALVSAVLRVAEADLRVVAGDVGGAFGMKGDVYHDQILVLWASKLLERPVRWTAERTESLMSDTHARDNITTAELALDRNGTFLGFRVNTIANLGAYLGTMTPHSPTNNLGGLAGVYTTPAIYVAVSGVFSNKGWTGPYRGAGRPEASLAIEKAIDRAAAEMGIDRAEIRRRNLIPLDAIPYQTGLIFNYDSGDFEDVLDKALALADYDGFEARRAEARSRGRLRGIGLACAIEQSAAPLEETAEIRFDPQGNCSILMGTLNQGQGHDVTFKQLVNEMLGIPFEKMKLVQGDTDIIAHGRGTFGSRSAGNGGAALGMASERIIEKGKTIAAHMLEAAEADIEFSDGEFGIKGTDRHVNISDVAKLSYNPMALPPGIEPTLTAFAAFRPKAPTFPNGTHLCEVEIDTETGVTEFISYIVVDDVGTVVNPLLLKGQIHGGISQGLGQAMCEDVTYDAESGQLLAASFMDYCMPRADDMCAIEVVSAPTPSPTNPLGIKGAGEAGCVGALPCVQSALIDALTPLGVTDVPMPATPHKLWQTIQAAKVKDIS
jgi:carbon-monoxide dehydrogenase large subunit